MKRKYLSLGVLFFLLWQGANGQSIIKGIIQDSLGLPISYTQVLLKPKNSSAIIAFGQSNSNGEYNLSVNSYGEFMLEFKALSYQSKAYPITILKSQREHEVTISPTLVHQSVSINEVMVMGERPIIIKRDTVIFRVSAFTKGDEQVAEDILKRLPGITVSDNGAISWQGKEVEKVMVEGDDIFGKGYRLISRNLHVGVIDNVEVYERYSHNSLLKDIEYSDKVALNLTLRDDVRLTFFGNTSAGYSSNQTYLLRGSIMSLGKKEKYYLFGNSNSIGINPTGDIKHFITPQLGEENSQSPVKLYSQDYIINLRGIRPSLKEQRVRDNNSNMLSFSTILKPHEKLTVKLMTFGTYELDNFFREGYQKFNFQNYSFTNTESHNLTTRMKNGLGQIELKYDHSSRSSLEYQGQMMKASSRSTSKHIFNLSHSEELLYNSATTTNHKVVLTNRLSSSSALIAKGQYYFDQRPEEYNLSSFSLAELFPNIPQGIGQLQSTNSRLHMGWAELKTIWRIGEKYIINAHSGGLLQFQSFSSNFTVNQSNGATINPGTEYSNNLSNVLNDMYIGSNITRVINNLSINTTFDVHWLYSKMEEVPMNPNIQKLPFIEPKVGAIWKANKKNKVQVVYIYNSSPSSLLELMNGMVLINSRSFLYGTGLFSLQRAHSSLLLYEYGRVTDIFQLRTSFVQSTSNRALASKQEITPSYNTHSLEANRTNNMFRATTSADIFIRPIRSNFKATGSFAANDYDRIVNGSLSRVSSKNISVGGELRSALRGVINYHFGSNWLHSSFSSPTENYSMNNYQFLDFHLKFSQALSANINSERYFFGNINSPANPWYFIDCSITYVHKPNKLTLTIIANNILNNKEFGNINITEISESGTFFRIVPRYFMLRVDVRF